MGSGSSVCSELGFGGSPVERRATWSCLGARMDARFALRDVPGSAEGAVYGSECLRSFTSISGGN